MWNWLLLLLALGAFAFAALLGLPRLGDGSPLPEFGGAAFCLVIWAGAGLFLMVKGDDMQRFALFCGTFLGLLVYGAGLSLVLPYVLRT